MLRPSALRALCHTETCMVLSLVKGSRFQLLHRSRKVIPAIFAIRSAQCAERRADLFGEELRLFPGGEVAALGDLVVVDEVGIGPFGPAARRFVLLAREDARGHRNGHALGVEEATL